MSTPLTFSSRVEFRGWLEMNHLQPDGVWLLFGKPGGPLTLKADEALEEALCFGWIDGQMRRLDDHSYVKYFAPRRKNSKWSDKNKHLVIELARRGLLTGVGQAKIDEARDNGQWQAVKADAPTPKQQAELELLLKPYETAFANFVKMSPSVRKTYTRAYMSAKTEAGRQKRLAWIVDRLNQNLKPM